MPARIVPPSAALWSATEGDGRRPLDLEAELRRAISQARSGWECQDLLDEDALDALASMSCEIIGGSSSASSPELRRSLLEACEEVGVEDESAKSSLLEVLLLEARREEGEEAEQAANNNTIVASALLPPRKKPRLLASEGSATGVAAATAIAAGQAAIEASLDDAASGKAEQVPLETKRWSSRGDIDNDLKLARTLELQAEKEAEEREWFEQQSAVSAEAAAALTALGTRGPARNVKSTDSQDSDSEEGSDDDELQQRDREATKNRLRELGHPATLFGEDDDLRLARLRRHELGRDQDELASGSTNVMQILDRKVEREIPSGMMDAGLNVGVGSKALGDDEDDPDDEAQSEEDPAVDEEEEALAADTKLVAKWLRTTLREWETVLTVKAKEAPNDATFKLDKAQYRQCKQYLRPLRRSLRANDISPDIISSLARIANLCEKRHYKAMQEAYMRLAIGNKPWPMGVTFVTFHDRANRHKIGEGQVAHVLDDETTRKYVQMVKRLCSFCETRWPIDPTTEM